MIYPGGNRDSNEGYVTITLDNLSDKSIRVDYGISVKDDAGKEVVHKKPNTNEFEGIDTDNNGWCYLNFATRSTLIDELVNGTLVFEVRLRPAVARMMKKSTSLFIPKNPININILELLEDEESADVMFEVGGHKHNIDTTATFYAHRLILKKCAPSLYDMCVSSEGGNTVTNVPITDVTPEIFKHMLYYIYGGEVPKEELEGNTQDIIDACDKYGVVHLKLEAEACYVKTIQLSIEDLMDNLLYADSKNLALLKEAVMDYIVANKNSIIGNVSFDNVPGSTVTDILTAMARVDQNEDELLLDSDSSNSESERSINYNKMRVSELRGKLDQMGFDVDGSREAMISILKEQS